MNSSQWQKKLNAIWYQNQPSLLNLFLIPASFVFKSILFLRHLFLHKSLIKNKVPVVVIGNLTVGGSGKTPAIMTLLMVLQQQGRKPGVISRGYPISPAKPMLVNDASAAAEVGDEALLIFKRTRVPVVVCADRKAALATLMQQKVDLILSDDGLQNFNFTHDIEIVIYDERLGFGNERLLPAGPLREPLSRLEQVDFILKKEVDSATSFKPSLSSNKKFTIPSKIIYPLTLYFDTFISLTCWKAGNKDHTVSADYFQNKRVVAITAIAHPESFFEILTRQGISCEMVEFQDHYAFTAKDFQRFQGAEILMTEKDAIKCLAFFDEHFWCLPLQGKFSPDFEQAFLDAVTRLHE